VALQPVALPVDLKEKLKLEQDTAVMLLGVEPNGPAASGGLIMGDILLQAGNNVISDAEALAETLDSASIGQELNFRVLRAGAIQEVLVRIGERPRKGK
jgi:S1-C subfamily serine protease